LWVAYQQPKLIKDQLLVRFTILELDFKVKHQQRRKKSGEGRIR